jgi:diphthamide biosynthesis methyltransferase
LASDVYESQFAGRTTREQMELLRELARDKDTIQLARGVQSIIRDERRVQVRGLTPKEQLLGKMAIGTGQRAKVLAAELKDLSTEDRNRRLDELARKGLVNQKVRQDVMKELYGQ